MLTTLIILKSLASLGQPCLVSPEVLHLPSLKEVKIVIIPDQSVPLLRDFPVEVAILDDRRRNQYGVIEHQFPAAGNQKNPRASARGRRNIRHRSGTRGR